MKRIRETLQQLERRADAAELNENHGTARLLRKTVALVEAAAKEDERRSHQCLEEELDLQTASHLTGVSYPTLARRVQKGDIPDVGVGGRRKVRVADLPCEAGYLRKLLGVESPEGETADDPDTHSEDTPSDEELAEYRRERLRRTA